jgi:hypothetical protein
VLAQNPDLEGLPRRYYARAKKFAWPQWDATSQLDLRWNGTDGDRPWHSKITQPIAELIVRAGQHDRTVSKALLSGAHILKTPQELLTPNVMFRVLLFWLRQLMQHDERYATELPEAPHRNGPLPSI